MAITTLVGLVMALLAVLGSLIMDGGSVMSLVNPSAMLLVLVGTAGATVAGLPMSDVKRAPSLLIGVFRPPKVDVAGVVSDICRLAEVARREGLLRLEEELDKGELDPFLARGISLVVDGSDEERIRSLLEEDVAIYEEDRATGAAIFETAGGYAPTLGIIGTVMGLVSVLSNLSDVAKLAPSIAVAFTATLWGVASANLFWLPMANNLKGQTKRMVRFRMAVVEGCVAITRGQNPRVIEEALSVYQESDKKADKRSAPGKSETGGTKNGEDERRAAS